MFPLSDTEKSHIFPFVSVVIILINVVVFLGMIGGFFGASYDEFVYTYALVPDLVSFSDPSTFVTFLTSMFLHGGFFHIISNMWFLWIFGDNVEAYLGKVGYLAMYVFAGLVGAVAQYLLNPESAVPMLGASGAVSGVMGAYYVLFRRSQIKTLVIFFFTISVTYISAVVYIFYWFFIQLLSGVSSIPSLSNEQGGVAFFAHIGGFVAGYAIAKVVKNSREKGYIEGEIVD